MDNADDRKKALLREFFELDRQGLIVHDWSETAKTGLVKVRVKPHLIKNDNDRFTS
jgi:hypothetical protein